MSATDRGVSWPPSWYARAACRGMDPNLFFPGRGESNSEALTVCRSCPVRFDCLEQALGSDERLGIWGGLSERERRRLRREIARRREAA